MRYNARVLAGLLVLFGLTSALAQSGAIRVKVVDRADKSALPGVTVILRNSMQYVPTTTVLTNKDGIAEFPVLRAGSGYSIEVSFPGYAKQVISDIKVPINQVQQINIALTTELVEREVVTGKRETVDLEKTSTSTKFGEDFIQDLPVQGRFYQNVLQMAAGVQDPNGDGNPNVNGARNVDFKAQVDGVSNQDPLTGLQLSQVNPDSIEEIEVITAGAGVEFGRAQGGFANIIQKQGSNDFEGTFNFLYKSNLLDGSAAAFPGAPQPRYEHLEPAIQLSGPIVRDKLWYRLSHEYIREEEPVTTSRGGSLVTTHRQINSDAVTWQVSPRNKLQFTYSADPLTVDNFGVSALRPPESTVRQELGGPLYRVNWTAPFSAKILVDTVVSYQDSHVNILPMSTGIGGNCVQSAVVNGQELLPFLNTAQCTDLTTGQVSGSYYLTYRDQRQRFTMKTTASIFGGHFWGMDHQFKVGLSVENERYHRNQNRLPDVYFYVQTQQNSSNNQNQGKLEQQAVVATRVAVPEQNTARATGTAPAIFLEDVVKPRQNLSITLGVRLDNEQINSDGFQPFDPAAEEETFYNMREQMAREQAANAVRLDPSQNYEVVLQQLYDARFNAPANNIVINSMTPTFTAYEGFADFEREASAILGIPFIGLLEGPVATASKSWVNKRRQGNINIDNLNFGPHLAVSWDPWSNGKTKISGSARRYYAFTPLVVPLSELDPAIVSMRFVATRQAGGTWSTSPGTGINPAPTIEVVDRNLRTPHNDELTLAFERELWAETSMKATYIYRRFKDQFQDVDLNHYPSDFGKCILQVNPKAQVPGWITVNYDDRGRLIGDGIKDDCDGKLIVPFQESAPPTGGNNVFDFATGVLHRPDGYLDTYTHNVGWGSIFLVGNFNDAVYRSFQLELVRRQYRNWQMNASYVYATAIGDAESWNSSLGDDRTTRDNEHGYLSYDVRHAVKVNATSITPWGFRLGTAVSWQTGLPYSILVQAPTQDSVGAPMATLGNPEPRYRQRYPTGQRNDQRNRPYWNVDVKVDKEMNLSKGLNLQVAMDIFNLLNDRQYVVYNQFTEQGVQLNGANDAYLRTGRTYQLSMKLAF